MKIPLVVATAGQGPWQSGAVNPAEGPGLLRRILRMLLATTSWKAVSLAAFMLLASAPDDAGAQSVGAFTRIGFGARGIGLGNAVVGDRTGGTSAFYNPALAPFARGQHLELATAFMRFDRQLQHLQFGAPLERAGIAAGLVHAGVSSIDGRDSNGFHTDDLSTDEFAFFLAFGLQFTERVSGGINLQLFRSDLLDGLSPETSIGLDVGVSAQVTPGLSIGLVLDDLLAKYDWDTSSIIGSGGGSTTDRFPVRVRLGAAYELASGKARILAEVESRVSRLDVIDRTVELVGDTPLERADEQTVDLQSTHVRFGAEYLLHRALTVRAGVDRLGSDGLDEVRPGFGFTVEQDIGSLQAAFEYVFQLEPYAVGTFHMLALRIYL